MKHQNEKVIVHKNSSDETNSTSTSNAKTTTVNQKKGWKNKPKGAVIVLEVGAFTGAMVEKRKAKVQLLWKFFVQVQVLVLVQFGWQKSKVIIQYLIKKYLIIKNHIRYFSLNK